MGNVDGNTGAIIFPVANGQSVIGRIMTIPAMGSGSSNLPNNASFLRSIILVR
jgi:predicted aconitase with swiveling domain